MQTGRAWEEAPRERRRAEDAEAPENKNAPRKKNVRRGEKGQATGVEEELQSSYT